LAIGQYNTRVEKGKLHEVHSYGKLATDAVAYREREREREREKFICHKHNIHI